MCVEAYFPDSYRDDFFPRPDDQIVFNDWVIPSVRTGFFLHQVFHPARRGMLIQLEKVSLLILDDFGLAPMDHNTKLALLQILEDRYAKKSVIIASQLPIGKWHAYIAITAGQVHSSARVI